MTRAYKQMKVRWQHFNARCSSATDLQTRRSNREETDEEYKADRGAQARAATHATVQGNNPIDRFSIKVDCKAVMSGFLEKRMESMLRVVAKNEAKRHETEGSEDEQSDNEESLEPPQKR